MMDLTPWMPGAFLLVVGMFIFWFAPRGMRWLQSLGLFDAAVGAAWIAFDWIKGG